MSKVNKNKIIWLVLLIIIAILAVIILLRRHNTPSQAIRGGEIAPVTRWVTKVVSEYPDVSMSTYCTGVAVSANYVLTVRHCVQYEGLIESNITIYYSDGPENQPAKIGDKIDKLNFSPLGKIVLIHLTKPHQLESYPKLKFDYIPNRYDVALTMGYGSHGQGSPNIGYKLYQAEVTIIGAYQRDGIDYIRAQYGTGINYKGDSGGPLLINYELVGVDSAEIREGGEIYNDLRQNKDWLMKTIFGK